jgi:hypothetical protein
LVEGNQRSQNRINFDDSATIEPAQRGSVLDRPGSEIHDARTALFSAKVSSGSLATSSGWV